MPHRCPAAAGSIPEVHLAAPEALRVGEQEAEDGMLRGMGDSVRSLAVSDGGIHVYAHQRSERAAHATQAGSEEVSEQTEVTAAPFPVGCGSPYCSPPFGGFDGGALWSRGEELCCLEHELLLPACVRAPCEPRVQPTAPGFARHRSLPCTLLHLPRLC